MSLALTCPADTGVVEVPDDPVGGERHEEWATA
jgi:hypothetical protein